ncbi:glycoside hydrolase family 47 protein [Amanita muscaria Koide BX008]|uniref:alpha-1,2-Mannosidase n=1 Tax=Amanita muscaria (strain Koide BX008) TaxID=946122 RepID=A0A0C2X1X6_AMAMK|nr:glycoside hydrolase family 47 protein [Amanita muscaria Koide BX008]
MKLSVAVSVAATVGCLNVLLARAGTVQSSNIKLPDSANSDRAAVKQLFDNSYQAYLKFAQGHDEVTPVDGSFTDPRNGWGASIVDGLDTMAIMGEDLTQSLKFISSIDFSKSNTPDSVSVFESTIRYVGGLLSAYELTGKQHQVLVQKAQQLADKLAYAWVGANEIPYGDLDFSTNTPVQQSSNIAEAGSLTLEFGTLSKYTNNQKYADLALKSAKHIANLPAPLPGLAAQDIDPSTGQSIGGYVTWGGGSDSCFEYYLKYTQLFNPSDTILINTWSTAVDSSLKTLFKTSTQGDFSYLADFDDSRRIRHVGSHLACFYGGNWILGGKLLNNQTIVDYGLALTDGCWNTYASTKSGIGPETFAFKSDDGDYTGSSSPPTQNQNDFYNQHGFYITSSDYILRPEVLESNFYAWRATGDVKYYERAQAAVQSFNKTVVYKPNGGAVGLNDVDNPEAGYINETPSFWFAEVLKYLYLTFDDPNNISLDTHVFNTEGHPFKAPAA